MKLSVRLVQSADWCNGVHRAYPNSKEWARLQDLEQDFRDAAAEIEDLIRWNASNAAEARDLRLKVRDLEEQLQIAATNDTEEFRQRERKHTEAVMTGYSLAISAMVAALKGGK